MIIVEENQGFAATLGDCSADPYLCSLASGYASASRWFGVYHPSLPNYLALTSGSAMAALRIPVVPTQWTTSVTAK